jgi:hypothetical protein
MRMKASSKASIGRHSWEPTVQKKHVPCSEATKDLEGVGRRLEYSEF